MLIVILDLRQHQSSARNCMSKFVCVNFIIEKFVMKVRGRRSWILAKDDYDVTFDIQYSRHVFCFITSLSFSFFLVNTAYKSYSVQKYIQIHSADGYVNFVWHSSVKVSAQPCRCHVIWRHTAGESQFVYMQLSDLGQVSVLLLEWL